MKKNYILLTLILTSTVCFGQLTQLNGNNSLWSKATWTNGLPSAANITQIGNAVTTTTVDVTATQRIMRTTAARTVDLIINGTGTHELTTDVNFVTNSLTNNNASAILHQSATASKITIDCNIKIANSLVGHSVLRVRSNTGNILEFGANSVLEITGNSRTHVFAELGAIEFNGTITGDQLLVIGTGSISFGASSHNPNFSTSTSEIQLWADANLIVNTQSDNTFFKNTAGGNGRIQMLGATSSLTINTANVWDSPLIISTTGTGANLVLNDDQIVNTGVLSLPLSTSKLNLTKAEGKNISFGNSSGTAWDSSAILDIIGFEEGTIRFGTNSTGLTAQQLSQITIEGASAELELNSEGYLVLGSTLSSDETNNYEFSVYPNPVKDLLYINSKETVRFVEAYDVLGNVILRINKPGQSIDVSGLKQGVYVLRLETIKGIQVLQKMIIR